MNDLEFAHQWWEGSGGDWGWNHLSTRIKSWGWRSLRLISRSQLSTRGRRYWKAYRGARVIPELSRMCGTTTRTHKTHWSQGLGQIGKKSCQSRWRRSASLRSCIMWSQKGIGSSKDRVREHVEDLPWCANTVVWILCAGTPCKTWLQKLPVSVKQGHEQEDCEKILEQAHGRQSWADAIGLFTVQRPHQGNFHKCCCYYREVKRDALFNGNTWLCMEGNGGSVGEGAKINSRHPRCWQFLHCCWENYQWGGCPRQGVWHLSWPKEGNTNTCPRRCNYHKYWGNLTVYAKLAMRELEQRWNT